MKREKTTSRRSKYIQAIIAAVVIAGYYVAISIFIARGLLSFERDNILKFILIIIVPLLPAACVLAALISRIKEIKGGEEDDLSNY